MYQRKRKSYSSKKRKPKVGLNKPSFKKLALKHMKADVHLANSKTNLTQVLDSWASYSTKENLCFELSCITLNECSEELFKWMMDLLEINMSDLYKGCEWGWNVQAKKKEMSEANARFIVAYRTQDMSPAAFSHFRFDIDEGVSVVYCYELQLDKASRSLGLGKHMLGTLECIGKHFRLRKVVLTVFNSNKKAFNFFISQGYMIDESSPQNFSVETFYSILSKPLHSTD